MSLLRRTLAICVLTLACVGVSEDLGLCPGLRLVPAFGEAMPEGRLMRFPDIYKDQIVFSYGGDLWLVPSGGGVARRITTHLGLELFPKFSPDGTRIAFTGQYDGNFNVYVIPAEGGEPRQLTFHPGAGHISERMGIENEVLTWFPDSQRIVYLSRRDTFNDWFGRPYVVSVDGGLPEKLPIDKGGLMSFSPDGSKMAYNRIFRNFRTWKRYTGGMAQDIWIYDFKANQIEQMPHTEWTDTFPMWHGDTIYFGSDRGAEHRLNLYSYSLRTKEIRQLTHFTEFDVALAQLGPRFHRLRERRLSLCLRSEDRESEQDHRLPARRSRPDPQTLGRRKQVDYRFRPFTRRQARSIRRARRCVYGAGQGRQHPQPDADAGHPGKVRRLVARWPMDRLHIRPLR